MTGLEIRGVPARLASDAWWLGEGAQADGSAPRDPDAARPGGRALPVAALALACLVCIADFLFWKQSVGLSLVVFSVALTGAAILNLRPRLSKKDATLAAVLWTISALPVVEFVQPVSVLFLIAGHCTLLAHLATRARGETLLGQALMMLPLMIRFSVRHLVTVLTRPRRQSRRVSLVGGVMAWFLPGIVGIAFAGLFLQANPLLERWAVDVTRFDPKPDAILRVAFWGLTVLVALPFVLFKAFSPVLKSSSGFRMAAPDLEGRVFNARSVTNSLLLFNALFLLQNATDMAVLGAGVALPEGMTYAEYAHQGAYPLMATSVLAGVFAVLSQRFVAGAPLLRALLLLWVAQNVVLAASALGRLDLYMYAYGLTYLRLRAAIGMGLVIAGMALLGWQIWRGKPTRWTVKIFAGLVIATVYVGSFVNFGHVIASANLARNDRPVDYAYICDIGPLAAKALHKKRVCGLAKGFERLSPEGWRDWSWRKARFGQYTPF